jgi:hypothetical protein
MISEAVLYRIGLNIPFNRDKCALFHYFAILNRWVCLKEREFKYSKFQQFINSTTHHILDLGGSSIPIIESESMLCSLSIESIYQAGRHK